LPRPWRVLLVEDDPDDAHLILRWLRRDTARFGAEPRHVTSQGDAFVACREQTFDAVLLDLGLPDASGLDGLRQFREAVTEPAIVVLTGLEDEAVGAKAIESGAQDYLVKGQVDQPLLLRSLLFAIERRRAQRLLRERARHEVLQEAAVALAHHIRNALTPVLGIDGAMDAQEACETLRLVQQQAQRVAATVDALEELAGAGPRSVAAGAGEHRMLDLDALIERHLGDRLAGGQA